MHHPLAGRVEVDFEPKKRLVVKTGRKVPVSVPDQLSELFKRSMNKTRRT